ncbi:MAG TPA: amidohydrolase family protein [Streptosporangiaceae bacterium]|nr:amidohydrolase family protein [Streptosporangiaceae bacterium]
MTHSQVTAVLTAAAIRPGYRSRQTPFRHIVISGGKIVALTHTAAEAVDAAKALPGSPPLRVDLGPACIGPGLIDTHIHALQAAADVRLAGLREARTIGDVLATVRRAALGRGAGLWTVTGRNWHESQLREERLPTGAELDALGLPGPVMVRRGSHLAVLNSPAAALLGVAADRPVGDDALIAQALALAGPPTEQERREDLATVLRRLAAFGLTSIREAGVDAAELELFRALREEGRLPLRCDLLWRVAEGSGREAAREQIAAMPAPGPADDPYLRLAGVKAFVDGRIADAAVDAAGAGAFRMTSDELWTVVTEALRRAGAIACHAVGDRAVAMVLDAYERALAAGLTRDPGRLVIEHALDCSPPTIRRLAASGVSVSCHPGIVFEFADEVRRHWGAGRAARAAPLRDLLAAGVRVAAGSDGDVPPAAPLRVIWFMAGREGRSGGPIGAGQSVPRDVAFDLYTRRAASFLDVVTHRSVLEPGADADLVAFGADPLHAPLGDLPGLEIMLTLVGGRPVHDPAGLMSGLMSGVTEEAGGG